MDEMISEELQDELNDSFETAMDELQGDGMSSEEAATLIAGILDSAVDFRAIVPGPLGHALEEIDHDVFKKVAKVVHTAAMEIKDLIERTPTEMRERAEKLDTKGKGDRAKRIRMRADRKEQRWIAKGKL
jgi:hypothetical protein